MIFLRASTPSPTPHVGDEISVKVGNAKPFVPASVGDAYVVVRVHHEIEGTAGRFVHNTHVYTKLTTREADLPAELR